MTEVASVRFKRLLAEGTAIVVSILLAFAIQAWWDGVEQESERVAALRLIEADFLTMRAAADSVLAIQRGHLGVATELLELIHPDASPSVPRADTLLSLVISGPYAEFHGDVGVLTTGSSRIELVEGASLRSLIARWPTLVETVAGFHTQKRNLTEDRLMPYLQSRVPIRSFDAAMGGIDANGSGFSLNVSPLLRQLEFENLMNDAVFVTTRTVESLERVVSTADEILELLRAELPD